MSNNVKIIKIRYGDFVSSLENDKYQLISFNIKSVADNEESKKDLGYDEDDLEDDLEADVSIDEITNQSEISELFQDQSEYNIYQTEDDAEYNEEIDIDELDIIQKQDDEDGDGDDGDKDTWYSDLDMNETLEYYFDILNSYYNKKKKSDTIYYEAEEFYNLTKGSYIKYDNKNLYRPCKNLLLNRNFSETNFIPIVSDKKKYFTSEKI